MSLAVLRLSGSAQSYRDIWYWDDASRDTGDAQTFRSNGDMREAKIWAREESGWTEFVVATIRCAEGLSATYSQRCANLQIRWMSGLAPSSFTPISSLPSHDQAPTPR